MSQGTIKVLKNGYGFIKVEGRDKDLFFHASEVANDGFNSLREGQTVSFEESDSPKGPKAGNVAPA